MAGEMCTIYPSVKGKKSKLYVDMYNKTGHDRKLTNFLYAMSKLDDVRAKFSKDQFDRLGEIKSKDFMEWVDIDKLIADQNLLDSAKAQLQAVDSNGDPIGYDTPEEVYDRVIDFNDNPTLNQNRMKAMIRFSNGKFIIEVENLNADNYGANRSLKRRNTIFNAVTDWLAGQGLKTNFSPETKTRYANTLQALGFERTIKDMVGAFHRGRYVASSDAARLLMDMFDGNPRLENLKQNFGDDLANVISHQSGMDETPITQESANLLSNPYWSNEVGYMLAAFKRKMGGLDLTGLETKKNNELSRYNDNTEYFGTPASEIYEALKELYRVSHVDKEEVLTDMAKAQKLSEAARVFLNNKYIALETYRRKTGGRRRGDDRRLRQLEQEIDRGRYGESIVSMLSDLAEEINLVADMVSNLDTNFSAAPDVLEATNSASHVIIKSTELADAYGPILEELLNMNKYELDELGLSPDIIDAIETLAASLNNRLTELKNNAKKKQFDVVYAYYSIYWGKDDQKQAGDEMRSLREILETARKDINFFDRYIYAMGESNDEALALFAAAVKDRNRARDEKAHRGDTIIRRLTNNLFESGSDSAFMYERSNGTLTGRVLYDIDWDKFEAEKQRVKEYYENQGYSQREVQRRLESWENNNTEWVKPFDNQIFDDAYAEYLKVFQDENANPDDYEFKIRVPKRSEFSKQMPSMTPAQQEYYYKMMAMKAAVTFGLPSAEFGFFDAPQVSTDVTTALKESGGDPSKVLQIIKNKVVDALVKREDDTDYGFQDTLEANSIALRQSDLSGQEAQRLPLFFTHKIKDPSRLSVDFSRGMEAIMTSSVQYNEMNKAIDALMLAKDWLINRRNIAATEGDKTLMDIYTWGRDVMIRTIKKTPSTALSAGLVADFTEANIYNKRHKDGKGHVSVFGMDVSYDKLTNLVTGYTSFTGLSMNLLGAQANALVGKLQMAIEAGCGEFFNIADWGYAEWEYFQEIWPMLNELASNNKTSDMALLMDFFDVNDDFIENLKRDGMYNNIISRIIGNSNILFMYGMGEHMLHAETMYAILHQRKVVNRQTGQTMPLRKAFEKKVESGVGELFIDYSKWDILNAEGNRRQLTKDDIETTKNQIAYCNKSMHGAMNGQIDKGMIHRYCFGRLIMNFRQWMPAHYQRRFRGLHYNYDLGEYREGYYTTAFKFVLDTFKEWNDGGWHIMTRWHELSPMELANMKRALAESLILGSLVASVASLGRYKDKKGNWAYRNLMYQLMRMRMETMASTPSPGFVSNMITVLNSPAACINPIKRMTELLSLTDLAVTIEGGKYDGENLWLHNTEKALPFLKQVQNQYELATEDDVFQVFK